MENWFEITTAKLFTGTHSSTMNKKKDLWIIGMLWKKLKFLNGKSKENKEKSEYFLCEFKFVVIRYNINKLLVLKMLPHSKGRDPP